MGSIAYKLYCRAIALLAYSALGVLLEYWHTTPRVVLASSHSITFMPCNASFAYGCTPGLDNNVPPYYTRAIQRFASSYHTPGIHKPLSCYHTIGIHNSLSCYCTPGLLAKARDEIIREQRVQDSHAAFGITDTDNQPLARRV